MSRSRITARAFVMTVIAWLCLQHAPHSTFFTCEPDLGSLFMRAPAFREAPQLANVARICCLVLVNYTLCRRAYYCGIFPAVQVEAEGDVATAFTLARILSNIPLSRGGPASVVIFDIHALQVCHSHCFLLPCKHAIGMTLRHGA